MMRQCRWKSCWSTSKLRSSGIFWSKPSLVTVCTDQQFYSSLLLYLPMHWVINKSSKHDSAALSILHCHNAPGIKMGSSTCHLGPAVQPLRTQLWMAGGLQAGQWKKLGLNSLCFRRTVSDLLPEQCLETSILILSTHWTRTNSSQSIHYQNAHGSSFEVVNH